MKRGFSHVVFGSVAALVLAGLTLAACRGRGEDRPRRAIVDAGPPVTAPRERTVATASVELEPTASARPEDPLIGTATLRATASGVDLEATVSGCNGGGPFPVAILDASDCEPASLEAQTWPRGARIRSILCVGPTGPGRMFHPHEGEGGEDEAWTIGGPAKSNVVGRALVVREPGSGAVIACGVIERAEDLVKVALPPADQPPRSEVRAQIAGLCLAKQFSPQVAGEECADTAALVACVDDHCELGACLETCAEHTACLDASDDACASAFTCPVSEECSACQGKLWLCASGYCPQLFGCTPVTTRDGPCGRLEACCALQGKGAKACLETVRLAASLGGDATCVGAMQDWDVLSHLAVPCKFEE